MNPVSGTPAPGSQCDCAVRSRIRCRLFTFSPGERKGDGPWGQLEGLRLDCISGNDSGKNGEKEVGGGPMPHGNALALIEDELSSSGQGQEQLREQCDGLSSICRACLSGLALTLVWEDLGAAWAFCSSPNSHVVQRMLGNYTIC